MRHYSQLLSAIGICFEIVKAIIDAVLDGGGSDQDVRRILKDKDLRCDIANVILAIRLRVCRTFKVVCDYSLSLSEMKGLDWVGDKINPSHFPAEGKSESKVEIELIQFTRPVTPDDAIVRLHEQGYRPATLAELYALAFSLPSGVRFYQILKSLLSKAKEVDDDPGFNVSIAGLGSVAGGCFLLLTLCLPHGREGKRYGLEGYKDDKRHELLASVFYAAVRI